MSDAVFDGTSNIMWRIKDWFPELSDELVNKFKLYLDILVKYNRTINLVSAKTIPVIDAIHFGDSICASRIIYEDNNKIDLLYDFGSGNGFPGMVFGILFPNVKVVLIDSDQRKCEFLKQAASALNIKNVSVECKTIEQLPADSVQFAMSRGLANISKSLLISRKALKKGAVLYHLKSEQWGLEVGEIPIQLCSFFSPALVKEYKVPSTQIKYAVVKTTKV